MGVVVLILVVVASVVAVQDVQLALRNRVILGPQPRLLKAFWESRSTEILGFDWYSDLSLRFDYSTGIVPYVF